MITNMTAHDIDQISLMIGRIEAKLDTLSGQLSTHVVSEEGEIKELNKRVGEIEKFKAYMLGISAAIGAVVSFLGSLLLKG